MVPRAVNLSLTPLMEEFGGGRRKRPAGCLRCEAGDWKMDHECLGQNVVIYSNKL